MKPIECAFFILGDEPWWVRITWKCPVCGRRNRVARTGPGKLEENLPITVTCKLNHETLVKPYQI